MKNTNFHARTILQTVINQDSTERTFGSCPTFPMDSTAPQWSEATEYTQLATTITPRSVLNHLLIEGVICVQMGSYPPGAQAFIFKEIEETVTQTTVGGSTVRGTKNENYSGGYGGHSTREFSFAFTIVAGTTSAITFRVGLGAFTGDVLGLIVNNGVYAMSSLSVSEILI